MTTRTDRDIHMDVMETLAFDPQIGEQNIAVSVKDGIVTLSGEVENHVQKVAAEQAVKRVMGVRGFAEELEVNPPAHHRRTDTELVEAALNTLKWSVLVPADRIQVKVEHGWVTLLGEVNWNFERESAQDAITKLTGVRGVSNKITVKPHDNVTVSLSAVYVIDREDFTAAGQADVETFSMFV